jgi:Concanavalin A-like lectin/glucanases superfamily
MLNPLSTRREMLIFGPATVLAALPSISRARNALTARETESAYERTVLASKPAAYWRLSESEGPTAHDASGNGNNGRYLGKPVFGQQGAIAADPNRAIGLEGPRTKSSVEVPDRDVFGVATSSKGLSVEVWMRPDVLNFQGEPTNSTDEFIHWLGKGERGRFEWGFRFYTQRAARPNRLSAYIWNADGKLGSGAYVEDALKAGAWIHLVATYDDPRQPDAQVRLYKDGKPSPHNASPGTLYKTYGIAPRHGTAPVRLGTRDLQGFLTGGLDEVAIYPRVLSAEEIRRHWNVAQGNRD